MSDENKEIEEKGYEKHNLSEIKNYKGPSFLRKITPEENHFAFDIGTFLESQLRSMRAFEDLEDVIEFSETRVEGNYLPEDFVYRYLDNIDFILEEIIDARDKFDDTDMSINNFTSILLYVGILALPMMLNLESELQGEDLVLMEDRLFSWSTAELTEYITQRSFDIVGDLIAQKRELTKNGGIPIQVLLGNLYNLNTSSLKSILKILLKLTKDEKIVEDVILTRQFPPDFWDIKG